MGMVEIRPLTKSKPLNRLRSNFAKLINTTKRTRYPNFSPIACSGTSGQIREILHQFFFARAPLMKWTVSGFWRTMAQNTQSDAKMCLLGLWTMTVNIYEFKFPKNRQNLAQICTAERLNYEEDWRHRRMTLLACCGVVDSTIFRRSLPNAR